MCYLLAIDIGNTNIALGAFKGKRLIKKAKIETNEPALYRRGLSEFVTRPEAEAVIISSVVPKALLRLKKILPGQYKPRTLILGENIKAPIRNLYKAKREVGQDRLVNAFAARSLYGAPCVVIDFGTAITFDAVSGRGDYLGGLILPGIAISLSSLHEKTALLPKVALKHAPYIIGKDTVTSMRGGMLFGFGAMCDGLVVRYRKIFGKDTKVIATGGDANSIKKYTKAIQIVDEDLTLKGLLLTWLERPR